MNRFFGRIVVPALVLLPLTAGCSNFKSRKALDMGPFAENTVTMLGEARKVVEPLDWNHLRDYRTSTTRDSVGVEVGIVRDIFRGIGFYSIQVVSLGSSRLDDKQRTAKLADYLDEVGRPIAIHGGAAIGLSEARLDSVLTEIRGATGFLPAIGHADALIYPIVSFGLDQVDRVAELVDQGLSSIDASVNQEFAETRRQTAELNALEEKEVSTYLLLQNYRAGKATMETIAEQDPSLSGMLNAKGKTRLEAANDAQRDVEARLASVDAVRKQLDLKNEMYAAQMAELDGFRTEMSRRVGSARLMLIYWSRAHRNLAQGVEIPPAIDLKAIAESSAKKAEKALP